jgi:hypothetical protein
VWGGGGQPLEHFRESGSIQLVRHKLQHTS